MQAGTLLFVSGTGRGVNTDGMGTAALYGPERSLAELLVEPVESTKVPPSSGSISILRS